MRNKTTALLISLTFTISGQYTETRAVTVPLQDISVEAAKEQDKQGGEQGRDPMKLMQEMMRLGTPGEPHKNLASLVGEWDLAFKLRMGPDQPWTDSRGTASFKSVLGGRYIIETVKGEFMGMPFEGMQIMGYNNFSKKYTAIWLNTSTTWPMTSTGTASDDGKTITYKGTIVDHITPKGRAFRSVVKNESKDKTLIEMYDTIGGKDVKVMMIVSTRKSKEGSGNK